jgi:hypothetical protein
VGSRILLFKRRLPAEWANRYCTVDTEADAVTFLALYTVAVNVAYYLLGEVTLAGDGSPTL